ncbi:MAG: flagellar protein export ATPase FliI [Gammaproteobacteria bacterium]|nr:flagellar protein export ATPase FliI [Gammaproteobacteria bacterium]
MSDDQQEALSSQRVRNWLKRLKEYETRAKNSPGPVVEGVLRRVIGMTMEAAGCQAPVGGRCHVISPGGENFEAEVVGFSGEKLFLMPTGDTRGIVPNARIIPSQRIDEVHVGDELLGRVIDGAGLPLDGRGPADCRERVRLAGRTLNPLARQPIREPLDVGIRAINSLLTVGRGQRIGLFAGSGVGKSRLLGMMTRFTGADVTVVGLIGERGREVKEFVEDVLGADGMQRAVVVATPADHPPLMRMHGAFLATSIAEYFRDRGKKVLLLMDSLTRFAQAQREIALAIGEPPATKGYPPSVFAKLPQLVERAGNGENPTGSITAFYTVLVEGDDQNDPIADATRAILDGHVVLSRQLAESGLYPAIDVEASISRAMTEITSAEHQKLVRRFRQLYTTYRHNEDLISVGAYRKGSDPRVDDAIVYWPRIQEFLRQDLQEPVDWQDSLNDLNELVAQPIVKTEEEAIE